jgi:hypothetical protein
VNHTEASLAQRRANARKMYEKKRHAQKCQRNHSNWGFRKDGRRYCITCKVDRNREWRKRPTVVRQKSGTKIVGPLTFEERQLLKQKISDVQRRREYSVRRMWITAADGERLSLGGGSAPLEEQIRMVA